MADMLKITKLPMNTISNNAFPFDFNFSPTL